MEYLYIKSIYIQTSLCEGIEEEVDGANAIIVLQADVNTIRECDKEKEFFLLKK